MEPRQQSPIIVSPPAKKQQLEEAGQEINMGSDQETTTEPGGPTITISVLGLAGITVNQNQLAALKKGDNKFHTNACPSTPDKMKCVVAVSQNRHIAGISGLSKPLTPATSRHNPDGKDARHIAVWANEQDKSLGSLMTMNLKNSKDFDLTIGLADGSGPLVALPIGGASVRLKENVDPSGDTMVLDIPIRHVSRKEMISLETKTFEPIPGEDLKKKKKKRWFSNKNNTSTTSPSLARRKAFSSVYGTDSAGDTILRVELQVTSNKSEETRPVLKLVNHNIVDLDATVVDDDDSVLLQQNPSSIRKIVQDLEEQEEEQGGISMEERKMFEKLAYKKLVMEQKKTDRPEASDGSLQRLEEQQPDRSASELAAESLTNIFRGALDLAVSQYNFYTKNDTSANPDGFQKDEKLIDRPPAFVVIDTAKLSFSENENTDPITYEGSFPEGSPVRKMRLSVPETKEEEPSPRSLARQENQEEREGPNALAHLFRCTGGGVRFAEDDYQEDMDAAFLAKRLHNRRPPGGEDELTEEQRAVPKTIQVQDDLDSLNGELTLDSLDFRPREASFPTIYRNSSIVRDSSILRKPRYSNPSACVPIALGGDGICENASSRKLVTKTQDRVGPDDESSVSAKSLESAIQHLSFVPAVEEES